MSEIKRVAAAIRAEFLRQRVDPTGLSSLEGIAPPLDWNAIGEAAIHATNHYAQTAHMFKSARSAIEDYDKREAAGEDVSNEMRPRMPGGSDW